MSQITPFNDHKTDVQELRIQLQDHIKLDPLRHDDALLLRFLRARKYDLPKTKRMFLDCEQWRISFGVNDIIESFSYTEAAEVDQVYPRFYHKTDKLGRPVYIERLHTFDVKRLFEVTDQDRVLKKHVREYEKLVRYRLPACSDKRGILLEQGCSIIDLKNVPLSSFNQVRKILQSLSAIAQNYYPETLGRMFIINAPTLFTTIWAIIRTMLDENTVSKISVIGSGYQKALLEDIDPENLPEFFGGTCKCPGGCDHSDIGPWNDGSVPGYPVHFWESFAARDTK
ncbi:hypothetical protein BASA50_001255 [Batrachochytrium salamandrivorans]|uniref:CRAL-TRIO domain-containing protein n=1 Tax=Batrachochytrium salamandrivorans TaxID=1357716 RepID=A0ABQ8EVR2_9FUNG|nr:hypothetical protein BASA62_004124 [Batrachochytrium salamandrivorans]KAH6574635.1 hypothetical protein BASA60_005400 [Batrachochytrium salamandrivorans]KAH6587326.1 hypothetical protein BASA50_001255 [Batrachochytrium salamandrivorans]KAH6588762.1 hypothetical protein BASA61_005826 [Batrachochytrium salamandrivorans]KAH9250785.1 hypothetical protein BASA81_011373 [Batrachochytrium salamandrivorans]